MMNAVSTEHMLNVSFPLAAIDAALKLICRDTQGILHFRMDEIPNKLIVYRISQNYPPVHLGDCGGIRLQFLTELHTRLSIEVEACNEEMGVRFGKPPEYSHSFSPQVVVKLIANDGIQKIEKMRKEILVNLCNQVIDDLTMYQPFRERGYKSLQTRQGGRPPLSREETIFRMALGLIEEHLKQADKNAKRGEVVILAIEKLNIPAKIGDVKDGAVRLGRARQMGEKNLLQSAQEQFQSWLPRL
jgi:hypothetical protein